MINGYPIKGKRYWFPTSNIGGRTRSGLFTGEYDKNGNALLLTKNGEAWSIPTEDLCDKPI